MENRKVMFLIQTLEAAGGERVVSELSLKLNADIEIVLFEEKIHLPYKGKLFCLDVSLRQEFFAKLYNLSLAFLRFRKIAKEENPDWVISFGNVPNIFNLLVKKHPIIRLETRIIRRKDFFGRAHDFLLRVLIGRAEKVIVVSSALMNDLMKHFYIPKEKIKMVYNPIDVSQIEKLSQEELDENYKWIFKNPVVINIGRLVDEKGQDILIKAFRKLKERNPSLQLVIIGEGKNEDNLKKLSLRLGVQDSIHFLGRQENPFKFLARSSVFVSSSLWEGFGLAILEAMACGLPVISSNCQGPREILGYGKYGLLFQSGEEEELAKVMQDLLVDEEMKNNFVSKSKKRAYDFDIASTLKEYDFLFK